MSVETTKRAAPPADAPKSEPTAFERGIPVLSACLVYIAVFSQAGLNQPFLPIWLAARGLSEIEIGIVVSAPLLLRIFVTPAIGALADHTGSHRLVMRSLASIVFVLALILSHAQGFWSILGLATMMMLFGQAIQPIVDASVLSLVRNGVARDFGRMRLWGSFSFAASTIAGGFILGWGGPNAVFTAYICAVALQIAASFILPGAVSPPAREKRQPFHLHKRPLLFVVFAVAALVLASHATFNSFGSIHLRSIGFADRTVGALWALATSSEIAMFWAGPLLARRFSGFGLLVLASSAALLRWSVMSLDPGLAITALLQCFHAATFSGSYLGLMRFVQSEVSDDVGARAQSAFVTMLGLTTAATTLVMGPLYQTVGAGAFLGAALLPTVALALLLYFRKPLQAAGARDGQAAPSGKAHS